MALYPGFPLAQSDYKVGTISLTANSKNFTLSGANPLDFAAAQAGDEIYIPQAGKLLLIETITNTGGTLFYNCPADCAGANQPFHLRLKPSASRLQAQITTLLQKLGSGNLASLDALNLPENHVIAGGQMAGEVKAVNLPAQMGAKLDKSGGMMTGEINSRASSALRFSSGDAATRGAVLHKNTQDFVLLLTDEGNRDGAWNALRPFTVKLDSGKVLMGCGLSITAGDVTFSGTLNTLGEIHAKVNNGMRFVGAGNSPSVIMRKDSSNFYFLLTQADEPYGSFNDKRPFHINLASGRVSMNEGLNVTGSINISSGSLNVGTSQHYLDGNIKGDFWKAWHSSGWLSNAIDARITSKTSGLSSGILDVRLAGVATVLSSQGENTIKFLPAGYVAIGIQRLVTATALHGKQVQVNVPGTGWRGVVSV